MEYGVHTRKSTVHRVKKQGEDMTIPYDGPKGHPVPKNQESGEIAVSSGTVVLPAECYGRFPHSNQPTLSDKEKS